jgi:beta-glucosidase/6-phospho-beta-glucosidase/beta-galactosidase
MKPGTFQSFFLGGFECSTHRLRSGRRLDLVRSTQHDEFAIRDYLLLQTHGIYTVREGLRWHLIEAEPGRFDFSSAEPIIRAARETGMQVIWDLWHYGWPDDIDIFAPQFIQRFKNFARAATELLNENFDSLLVSPINEISFFSWAGGEGGIFNPFAKDRGDEMKRQLVRATIEAITAIREIAPEVQFCQIEPIINVIADDLRPWEKDEAEVQRQSQFQTWDMLVGRAAPELGGSDSFLDLVGVNYYIHNQWVHPGGHGTVIVPSDRRYRHVRDMLEETHARYGKPIFVAETGIEDETRAAWLRYICNEVYAAISAGVPIEGVCLYPILNHPGWDDDRHCHNGLFDYANQEGDREVFEPLARELSRQQQMADEIRSGRRPFVDRFASDTSALDWAAHAMEDLTDHSRVAEPISESRGD